MILERGADRYKVKNKLMSLSVSVKTQTDIGLHVAPKYNPEVIERKFISLYSKM